MNSSADRNLLIGVLTYQMEFIEQDELIDALTLWVNDKLVSLDQLLVDRKMIDDDTRNLVIAVVDKHLAVNRQDAEESLHSLSVLDSKLLSRLSQIVDPQLSKRLEREIGTGVDEGTIKTVETTQTWAFGNGPSGRFTVVRPLDEGGLGKISVALDNELHREVALKEIRSDFVDNEESRVRFELEAEITGCLEHPGIVPVYGKSAYEDGRPYYAMKLIRGNSLKVEVDRCHTTKLDNDSFHSASFRNLLQRFISVCQAVGYAHERKILHRDIKPSNIMLGRFGETLVVDWGLAKPIATGGKQPNTNSPRLVPPSYESVAKTLDGSAVGTPAYMSPEQAAGRIDLLAPTSDIYSLGATLYYVLTGTLAIDEKEVGAALKKVEAGDFPAPRETNQSIPIQLDAICSRAMSVEPSDRYASAESLADDIERFLAGEPVQAYPEPWSTRSWRWIGKHRTKVASITLAGCVALISALVLLGVIAQHNRDLNHANQELANLNQDLDDSNHQLEDQAIALSQAKEKAEAERDRYNDLWTFFVHGFLENLAISDFSKDAFAQAVRESCDEIERLSISQRLIEGELRAAFGRLSVLASDVDSAKNQLLTAVDILETEAGPEDASLLTALNNLGELYRSTGQYEKAYDTLDSVLKARQNLYGSADDRTLTTRVNRASVILAQGDVERAILEFQAVAQIRSESLEYGPNHRKTLSVRNNYGYALLTARRFNESIDELQSAIDTFEQAGIVDPSLSANLSNNLGASLYYSEKYKMAVDVLVPALENAKNALSETDPLIFEISNNLAEALYATGKIREALDLRIELQEAFENADTLSAKQIVFAEQNLGSTLKTLGDLELARYLTNRCVEVYTGLGYSLNDVDLRFMTYQLADNLIALGEYEEAERHAMNLAASYDPDEVDYDRIEHLIARLLPRIYEKTDRLEEAEAQYWQIADDAEIKLKSSVTRYDELRALANALVENEQYERARVFIDQVRDSRDSFTQEYDPNTRLFDEALDGEVEVELLAANGEFSQAVEQLRSILSELKPFEPTRPIHSITLARLEERLGQLLMQAEDFNAAIPHLRQSLQILDSIGYRGYYQLAEIESALVHCLARQGRTDDALALLQSLIFKNVEHELGLKNALSDLMTSVVLSGQ